MRKIPNHARAPERHDRADAHGRVADLVALLRDELAAMRRAEQEMEAAIKRLRERFDRQ